MASGRKVVIWVIDDTVVIDRELQPHIIAVVDRLRSATVQMVGLTADLAALGDPTSPQQRAAVAMATRHFSPVLEVADLTGDGEDGGPDPERATLDDTHVYASIASRLGVRPEACVVLATGAGRLAAAREAEMEAIEFDGESHSFHALEAALRPVSRRSDRLETLQPADLTRGADELRTLRFIMLISTLSIWLLLPWWLSTVDRFVNSRLNPAWQVNLLIYITAIDGPLLVLMGLRSVLTGGWYGRRVGVYRPGALPHLFGIQARQRLTMFGLHVVHTLLVFWLLRQGMGAVGAAAATVGFTLALHLALPAGWLMAQRSFPLPPGPLHDTIDEMAAAAGVGGLRVGVLRVAGWSTVVNAAVIGAVRPRLAVWDTLERLPLDEQQAIIAHELGHLRRHHLRTRVAAATVMAALGTAAAVAMMNDRMFGTGHTGDGDPHRYFGYRVTEIVVVLLLHQLVAPWWRRQEHDADLHALDTTRNAGAVRRAFVSLARANAVTGGASAVTSMGVHPSLAARLAAADRWESDDAAAHLFDD